VSGPDRLLLRGETDPEEDPVPRRVGLFVTCLVDLFRPSVGFAAVRLLEDAGCEVVVPATQTCCGQPAWNAGDRRTARDLALAVLDAFADVEYVVAPSGSCTGMLRQFPEVLGPDHPRRDEAEALASRAFELTAFLVDVCAWTPLPGPGGEAPAAAAPVVSYHDACAGLRECGVKAQPRALLRAAGVVVEEMDRAEVCCGFGGTFCVKYPEISAAMADDKLSSLARTEAPLLVAGDLGCLLHLAGRLSREGSPVRARHVAELLAGTPTAPALGEPRP
jgi:L-lactate dehydrogenase complex protein LldE